MIKLNNCGTLVEVQYEPRALREGCFQNCILRLEAIQGVILLKKATFLNNNCSIFKVIIELKTNKQYHKFNQTKNHHKNQISHRLVRLPSLTHGHNIISFLMSLKPKFQHNRATGQTVRPEIEIGLEIRQDTDQEVSDKLFSFNQSFTNVEHNDKIIQEKNNSFSRIRALQDELKLYKTRSFLWERAKTEILRLNKSLDLSAISLECGDVAIMEEFFQAVADLLSVEEGKSKQERNKVNEKKKKESELFQKLVESNKKKYELQQKIIQCQQEIQHLKGVNDNLREKSRTQSTERSEKIRELHEETLITIQQRDSEVLALQNRIKELTQQIFMYEQRCELFEQQNDIKNRELAQMMEEKQQLKAECETIKEDMIKRKEDEEVIERGITQIREEMNTIVEENISIRQELARRSQCIQTLRRVIQNAQMANEEYLQQLREQSEEDQIRKQQNISALLQKQIFLKTNLKENTKFCIFLKKQGERNPRPGPKSLFHLDTEQLLI